MPSHADNSIYFSSSDRSIIHLTSTTNLLSARLFETPKTPPSYRRPRFISLTRDTGK